MDEGEVGPTGNSNTTTASPTSFWDAMRAPSKGSGSAPNSPSSPRSSKASAGSVFGWLTGLGSSGGSFSGAGAPIPRGRSEAQLASAMHNVNATSSRYDSSGNRRHPEAGVIDARTSETDGVAGDTDGGGFGGVCGRSSDAAAAGNASSGSCTCQHSSSGGRNSRCARCGGLSVRSGEAATSNGPARGGDVCSNSGDSGGALSAPATSAEPQPGALRCSNAKASDLPDVGLTPRTMSIVADAAARERASKLSPEFATLADMATSDASGGSLHSTAGPTHCSECSMLITGAVFMLHDLPYCCQRHRLTAYQKMEKEGRGSRRGEADSLPSTGLRASFSSWI